MSKLKDSLEKVKEILKGVIEPKAEVFEATEEVVEETTVEEVAEIVEETTEEVAAEFAEDDVVVEPTEEVVPEAEETEEDGDVTVTREDIDAIKGAMVNMAEMMKAMFDSQVEMKEEIEAIGESPAAEVDVKKSAFNAYKSNKQNTDFDTLLELSKYRGKK